MGSGTPVLVLCNRASSPDGRSSDLRAMVMDYRDSEGVLANVKLGLPCWQPAKVGHFETREIRDRERAWRAP